MTEYRAYTVGSDGHVFGFEPLVCENDDDAIAKACSKLDGRNIEVWSGPRFVTRLLAKKKPDGVTHGMKTGQMVPKA